MKDAPRNFSVRSLIAVVVVLGLSYFVLDFTSRFYYDPICRRYADSRGLTFDSSTMGSAKHSRPAECFFHDKNGNSARVEVSTLPLTSPDWVRRVLSWVAMIAGVGGSVWLASLIAGVKPRRRRRRKV